MVRLEAIKVWEHIAKALAASREPGDVQLAIETVEYLAMNAPDGLEAARSATAAALAKETEDRKRAGQTLQPDQGERSGSRER